MPDTPESAVGWAALFGEYDTSNGVIRFVGKRVPFVPPAGSPPTEETERPGVGLILSSISFADGEISADVEFEKVTPDSICEIAVAYDSNGNHVVTAGLGSESWAMFGIREFGEPKRQTWWDHRVGGDRSNLKPGRTYKLDVKLRGASVALQLDGVGVGTAEVASPRGAPRQIGMFCKGDHEILIRNFRARGVKPKAFVVMHFSDPYDDVYQDVIKEVCKTYDVSVLRADEISGPGLIIADIVREIATSQLIIADITPVNANIYFEVGYALALNKPTLLLAQKGTTLPFDVAGFRVLFYEDTIGGKKRLETGLRRHLDAILAE